MSNAGDDEDLAAQELAAYVESQSASAAITSGARPAVKAAPEPEPEPDEPRASSGNVRELPPDGSKEREDWKRKKKGKAKGPPPPPRKWSRLPEDCPVKPLGLNGDVYSFLDVNGQLIERSASWLNQIGIDALFSDEAGRDWLETNYPRIGEGGRINGIDREAVRAALMVACGELSKGGVFQARERAREAGAWAKGATLILHAGDRVLVYPKGEKPREEPLGIHDGFVYALSQAQPHPIGHNGGPPLDDETSPGDELLAMLRTWNFERAALDPAMLLGWIGCAMVGGALSSRPCGWVMGPPGTGKSHLQKLIRAVLGGDQAMIAAEDATAAGIWQRIERMSLPVLLDEVEADADNRKKQGTVELMRQAYSGGLISRGGSDHKAVVFRAQSAFLFSSVNPLPLTPQDLTRMAHFEMLALAEGTTPPLLDGHVLGELGRKLRQRLVDNFPRWAEHRQPWWDAINKGIGKQGQRMAETFGSLLAMQHMLLFDTVADQSDVEQYLEDGKGQGGLLSYLKQRAEQTGSDSERMLKRLCSKGVKVDAGDVRTEAPIRALIYIAADRMRPSDVKPNDPDTDMMLPNVSAQDARRILSKWGLTVVRVREASKPKDGDALAPGLYLAMAGADHTELAKIFYNTHWQQGGWLTGAKRLDGAGKRKVRFDQKTEWGTCIPIRHVLDQNEEEVGREEI